ncbi:MAG: MotA/TolQ/ExbB proton channel family protein [Myxococcota bacterium]|nr:MotA/TolQ/ExbB proton channel family protein [Myxococcota bacterium]
MSLTEAMYRFTDLGAEWVMWLLVGLSVLSVAVMVERAIVFRRKRSGSEDLSRTAAEHLARGDVRSLRERLAGGRSSDGAVLAAGIERADDGAEAAERAMLAAQVRERLDLERNLIVLGTVGANAPFIGLAGTVLGVIQAFRGLGDNVQAGASSAVMGAIAEALVATFIGLAVAVPAVIAFNYFQRRLKASAARSQIVAHMLLAHLRKRGGGGAEG